MTQMVLEQDITGAYIGAAIGDAMGGPVENNHAERIKETVGRVDSLLPYKDPYTLIDLKPGYALRSDAGAVTDDTFIRGDLTRYYLESSRPRTPEQLAEWLLDNADFDQWWRPAVEALEEVENTENDPRDIGAQHPQGGGNGWWTPVGIYHAGDPVAASNECKRLSTIWKAPVEQDLVAAVQAGVAEALRDDATYESTVEAMIDICRPLPKRLVERGAYLGAEASDLDELIELLYHNALFPEPDSDAPEPPRDPHVEMPPVHEPVDYTEDQYQSLYNHEQIPLAVAGFVFAEGNPEEAITATVNVGRDCDSTATSVGSWVGALHGVSALPDEWVDTVTEVNETDIRIRDLNDRLVSLITE